MAYTFFAGGDCRKASEGSLLPEPSNNGIGDDKQLLQKDGGQWTPVLGGTDEPDSPRESSRETRARKKLGKIGRSSSLPNMYGK